MKYINFIEKNNTGIIILNRPKSLNALNLNMAIAIKKKLKLWKKTKTIKRVMIKSNSKSFCAGGDIKAICISKKNSSIRKDFFKHEYELNYAIQSFPKPYLAIWNGIVMGGGVGISVYGNYRIATMNAKMAMPESAIGFFPDVGTSHILSKMNNSIGLYLALTGYVLNYYELIKLKLANHFVDLRNLNKFEDNFIKNGKINKYLIKKIPKLKSDILDKKKLIKNIFHCTDIEKIIKKLKQDNSQFSKKTLENLLVRCPMSLAITCGIFRIAKKMSFKYCLHMDYHFSQIMIKRNDFTNGVTSVLIDKNNNQKWRPDSLNKINNKTKNYFNKISTKKLNFMK